MDIISLVNGYGEKYSPYMGNLINNLPIGQLALYKISGDTKKVEFLTKYVIKRKNFDRVKTRYPKVNSIEECLGKRKLYESCLDIVKEDLNKYNKKEYISKILNKYEFGMSSGLYHTLTRVYYAVDAFEKEEELIDEVARSLAYYITAYREGDLFERSIDKSKVMEEAENLRNNSQIINLLERKNTIGKKIRALYNYDKYLELGFTIDGSPEDKIKSLLDFLLPTFLNTGNVVVFHCITGLQALAGLKNYYDNYERALDILTTTITTHLLSAKKWEFTLNRKETVEFSWEYILSLASQSTNIHNIEFASSLRELYKVYPTEDLKIAVLRKIDTL
ncbi:MAG TPA: hypothetical protein VFC60_02200 [Tissierellaceae bacterium]|nr:hypothetical protein [Tissierellaceae bacterium]